MELLKLVVRKMEIPTGDDLFEVKKPVEKNLKRHSLWGTSLSNIHAQKMIMNNLSIIDCIQDDE